MTLILIKLFKKIVFTNYKIKKKISENIISSAKEIKNYLKKKCNNKTMISNKSDLFRN